MNVCEGELFDKNREHESCHSIPVLTFNNAQFLFIKFRLILLIYLVLFSDFKNNFTIALLNYYMYF